MIKKASKIISVFVIAAMLAMSFVTVFADNKPEVEMSLEVSKNISAYGAALGQEFEIDFNVDFGDGLILREGISVLYAQVKFDPNVLEPIKKGDDYATAADYVEGDALSVKLSETGDFFTVLYGTTSSANIIERGRLLTLTFMPKKDLAVVDKKETDIKILKPSAHGADMTYDDLGEISGAEPFECTVTSSNKVIKVTPPYKMKDISPHKQNSILSINGICYIDDVESEALTATITDEDGNTVYEGEVTVSDGIYRTRIELTEDIFAVGKYKLTLSHGENAASKEFTVTEKDKPVTEPKPDDTKEPEGDDSGNKEPEGGSNSSSESGGGAGGVSDKKDPAVGNTNKADTNKDNNKADTKVDNSAATTDKKVVYPTDISLHWAKSNIEYVYDNKLMKGYADGIFGPENSITRAEFATVMSRFLGLDNQNAVSAFADTNGHWASGYIAALAEKGIVGGVSENAFEPDSNITREQIALILDRAFALASADKSKLFADDAQISTWARDGVYDVFAAGYMQGDTEGNFNPLANATRAEVATIIYRLHSQK